MKPKNLGTFLITLILVSCVSTPTQSTETIDLPTEILLTQSPIITITPQITPSLESIPTPNPTLLPNEAKELIQELIKTNGGCRLPCWWGIKPGKTNLQDALAFLSTFSSSFLKLRKDVYGLTFDPQTSNPNDKVGATLFVTNGVIEQIRVDVFMPLNNLMDLYGQPDEIWLFATNHVLMKPNGRFTLALYYSGEGILAIYNGITLSTHVLEICPSNIEGSQLAWILWSPAQKLTFYQVSREALLFQSIPSEMPEPYFPLEQVTNLNVKLFYERYTDSSEMTTCFEVIEKQ